MSAPYYVKATQTLPVYTHEFAASFLPDPCIISIRVDGGGTALRIDPTDPLALQLYTYTITDQGTSNPANIIAYYSSYPDLIQPDDSTEFS